MKLVVNGEVRNEDCLNIPGIYLKLSVTLSEEIKKEECIIVSFTVQKIMFSLRISLVNVTKSAVSCGFGHIYWKNL